ncbi:MAG: hypothetical protein ACE5LS_01150 [Thermoplasmata archaeon]
MKEVLDLSELLGLVRLDDFVARLEKLDFSRYEGKKVQMRGCVPVWAHLAVAAKLIEQVEELEFLVDDGKKGKPIQIYARA